MLLLNAIQQMKIIFNTVPITHCDIVFLRLSIGSPITICGQCLFFSIFFRVRNEAYFDNEKKIKYRIMTTIVLIQ